MDFAHRWLRNGLAAFVALAMLMAPLILPEAQAQDARSQAREHYKSGSKLYSSGDFKGAIAEFAEAARLAPSPLLEFNIALCYDKLGDASEALRRYQMYLSAMPNASNRSVVEGKVRRLEGTLREEAAALQAHRDKETAALKKEEADKAAILQQQRAEEEEAAALAAVATRTKTTPDTKNLARGGVVEPPASALYNPRAPVVALDPELARVEQVDVAKVRDGMPARSQSAGYLGNEAQQQNPQQPQAASPLPVDGDLEASDPFYSQWWFWVVAGVGAIILYNIATTDSQDETTRMNFQPTPMGSSSPGAGALEWRF